MSLHTISVIRPSAGKVEELAPRLTYRGHRRQTRGLRSVWREDDKGVI